MLIVSKGSESRRGTYVMCRESSSGSNPIFIDDSQWSKLLKLGRIEIGKGEGMEGFQPTMVSLASLERFADFKVE